ncbi:phage tail tape measure protein [Solemya pervernicosa gill symbiont]|nr:phage tail tape measure protein [Solemya pervernicosa gill symbiont]
MALAAATQSDLGRTTEIVSSSLSQFELEASEATRVANVYAAAISGSQANMQKLGDAMRYVGPVAKSLNQDIESTTAAVSMLLNAGFKGEQAGTALRASLIALNKPSKEAAGLIEAIGLKVTDVSGKFVGYQSMIEQLAEEQLDLNQAATLFGSEAAPAMLAMVGQGADEFNRMREAITGTGKALEMADAQTNTLLGDWKLFLSATEEEALLLYDDLQPALRSTVQSMQTMVGYTGEAVAMLAALIVARTVSAGVGMLSAQMAALTVTSRSAATGLVTVQRASAVTAARMIVLRNAAAAARSTLAFFGGPAGLAVTAVAGLAIWASSTRDVAEETENLTEKLYLLRGEESKAYSIRLQEQIRKVKDQIREYEDTLREAPGFLEVITGSGGKRKEVHAQLGVTRRILRELIRQYDELRTSMQETGKGNDDLGSTTKELTDDQQKLLDKLLPTRAAYRDYYAAISQLENLKPHLTADQYQEAMFSLNEQLDGAVNKTDTLTDATSALKEEIKALMDNLFPEDAAFDQYSADLNLLAKANLDPQQYQAAVDALTEQHLGMDTPESEAGSTAIDDYQEQLRNRYDALDRELMNEQQRLDDHYTDQLFLLEEMYDTGEILDTEYYDQRARIEANYLEASKQKATEWEETWKAAGDRFAAGIGDATAEALFEQESMANSMRSLLKGVAKQVISTLVEIGVKKVALWALEKSGLVATAAANTAAAATAAVAWAPAAAAASLAMAGANAVPAQAGIATTYALTNAMSLAGVAHAGLDDVPREGTYLLNQGEMVLAPGNADKLEKGLDQMADGGGGGDSYHFTFEIKALDGASVNQVIETKGRRAVTNIIRDARERKGKSGV